MKHPFLINTNGKLISIKELNKIRIQKWFNTVLDEIKLDDMCKAIYQTLCIK
jgi:hypothetical protein